MRTTVFVLEEPIYVHPRGVDPVFAIYNAVFRLPILPAFAVHHSQFSPNNCYTSQEELMPTEHCVVEDCLVVERVPIPISGNHEGVLTIYYSGIKDYSLLFPQVRNKELCQRLGRFAEEAELAFDSQSWMSYVMMVGAVVEGLLYNVFGKHDFFGLIDKAKEADIITQTERLLFDEVRQMRNRIHASRYREPFADRSIAMELSVTYDRLLKRNWLNHVGQK